MRSFFGSDRRGLEEQPGHDLVADFLQSDISAVQTADEQVVTTRHKASITARELREAADPDEAAELLKRRSGPDAQRRSRPMPLDRGAPRRLPGA